MSFSEIIFPKLCVGCGRLGARICTSCSFKMRTIDIDWCLYCGNKLNDPLTCHYCEGKRETIPIIGCWYYEPIISRAIWELKYKGDKQMALELCLRIRPKTLSKLITLKHKHTNTVLLPVPLHASKERERGYNQSHYIARLLSVATTIPLVENTIIRVKATRAQAKCTSKTERAQNVKGAFQLIDKKPLQGKTVILVDDVVTTGSTVREIMREIQDNRETKVCVFCIAREEVGGMEK